MKRPRIVTRTDHDNEIDLFLLKTGFCQYSAYLTFFLYPFYGISVPFSCFFVWTACKPENKYRRNQGLYKALDKVGINYEKTAVGDKYVYENMRENGHSIGGEQSGHVIFSKYANTGDGVLTAIKVMQVVTEKKTPLSQLALPMQMYPQVLKNVKVTDKDATLNHPEVIAARDAVTESLGDIGRIVLRKSGTEPVLRVMVEAPSLELCEEKVDSVIAAMDRCGMLIEVKK